MDTKSIRNFCIITCLFFAAAVSINSDSFNRIALYVAIPFAFLLSLNKNGKLFPNKYMTVLVGLYIWDMFSALWAHYPASANRELHSIFGAFLLTFIMASNAEDKRICKYLYITFVILYIGAWYYSYNNSLVIIDVAGEEDRLNDVKLNANTMAYYTFYTTVSAYFLSDMVTKKLWKNFFKILFLLMMPISFFVALTTASRQVLIIQIPLICLLLFERYIKNSSYKSKTIFVITAIFLIILLMPIVINKYNNSYLAVRSERNIQDDSRWRLIHEAVQVGIDNFPLGVGAGNYINYSKTHNFSHCSYTELFANNGVIGLFIYCYLICYFIKSQWKRYKITNDRKFVVFLIFGIIYAIDQFFYVFYLNIWLISFFILVATHSDGYYKQLTNNR